MDRNNAAECTTENCCCFKSYSLDRKNVLPLDPSWVAADAGAISLQATKNEIDEMWGKEPAAGKLSASRGNTGRRRSLERMCRGVSVDRLTFFSAQMVDQVLQGQEQGSRQHHRACCFKWDHCVGMVHSIAATVGAKDYGALVTVALRATCALYWCHYS